MEVDSSSSNSGIAFLRSTPRHSIRIKCLTCNTSKSDPFCRPPSSGNPGPPYSRTASSCSPSPDCNQPLQRGQSCRCSRQRCSKLVGRHPRLSAESLWSAWLGYLSSWGIDVPFLPSALKPGGQGWIPPPLLLLLFLSFGGVFGLPPPLPPPPPPLGRARRRSIMLRRYLSKVSM